MTDVALDPPRGTTETKRLVSLQAALGWNDSWSPTGPQLVLTGVLLSGLWAFVFVGLGEVMALGGWVFQALVVSATTILVTFFIHSFRNQLRASAVVAGAISGLFCWLWLFILSANFDRWLRDPVVALSDVEYYVLSRSAPLEPRADLVDVFLFWVWVASVITALLGLMRPLGAGVFVAAFLLVSPAVTGMSAGAGILVPVGIMLAMLGWIGSPDARWAGGIAALVAVAVAAGVMTTAPPSQDRVWNESLLAAPVADGVPDVTVALADDLREGSDNPVLWAKSSTPGPLRLVLATLSNFEGGHWSPNTAKAALRLSVASERFETSAIPGESGRPPTVGWSTVTVTIDGLLSSWLPLPQASYRVTDANSPGGFNPARWRWMADANTARGEGTITRRDNRYIAETLNLGFAAGLSADSSARRLFTNPESAPAEVSRYLELPAGLPDSISAAADSVLARAATRSLTDRMSIGFELESMFRGDGFIYDESAPYTPGMDRKDPYQVMNALLTERRGFCVHYASTFAVMARYLGVPTRVAIGYALRVEGDGGTIVKSRDLHAWPEILIDGVGWIAFEPTPGGAWVRADTGVDVPAIPEDSGDETAVDPSLETLTPLPVDPMEDPGMLVDDPVGPGGSTGSGGFWTGVLWFGIVLLVALAVALVPAFVRLARGVARRRRIALGDRAARNAWDEFVDTLVDLGRLDAGDSTVGPRARTAEALAEHLAAERVLSGEGANAARELADAMVVERYGAPGTESQADARALLDVLVLNLRGRSSRSTRLRAAMLPRSVTEEIGARWRRMTARTSTRPSPSLGLREGAASS